MKWISNNDPPLYVWPFDTWYNQKNGIEYQSETGNRRWIYQHMTIPFPKKTRTFSHEKRVILTREAQEWGMYD